MNTEEEYQRMDEILKQKREAYYAQAAKGKPSVFSRTRQSSLSYFIRTKEQADFFMKSLNEAVALKAAERAAKK